MKSITNLKLYTYNIKSKKLKVNSFKKLHVYANVYDKTYIYNRYIQNNTSEAIVKLMNNYRHSDDDTILSILSLNNLQIINLKDNKKTFKLFKEQVKILDECKVYGIPSGSDWFKLAYEFSRIENSKIKRR